MTLTIDKALEAVWLKKSEWPEWDLFVARHPLGLVYHLSLWKEALEGAFRHIKGNFLALRDSTSGEIVAGLPVYEVRSWLLGNRLVSIPFASICDPLISSSGQFTQMLPVVEALRQATSSSHVEIRAVKSAPWIGRSELPSSNHNLHHYLLLDKPPEVLRKDFSAKSIRYMIKQAQRQGLEITRRRDAETVPIFHRLLAETRKGLCLPPIPLSFFSSLARAFHQGQMTVFLAARGHDIIAAMLTLEFQDILHIEYYGAADAAYRTGASHILHWEAIKYAWEEGCRLVSFGRTSPSNEGLRDFKRRWNTVEEPIYVLRDRPNTWGVRWLERAGYRRTCTWIFGHAPRCIRLGLASFIYRHHG